MGGGRMTQKRSISRLHVFAVALAAVAIVALGVAALVVSAGRRADNNAATATYALGESERKGTEVAEQAADVATQATAVAEQADILLKIGIMSSSGL
jgi:hypothetical protein